MKIKKIRKWPEKDLPILKAIQRHNDMLTELKSKVNEIIDYLNTPKPKGG